jgi:hypothetical protein
MPLSITKDAGMMLIKTIITDSSIISLFILPGEAPYTFRVPSSCIFSETPALARSTKFATDIRRINNDIFRNTALRFPLRNGVVTLDPR